MPKVTNTKKHKGKHERDVCVLNGEINYKNKSKNEEIYHMRIYLAAEEENQESESEQVNNDKATKQGASNQELWG